MGKTNKMSERINQMVRRIVRRFDPERIILFGSHARGTANGDSDVDLLVIMPVSGSKREKQIEIGVALHNIRLAKDIFVVRPEEFERFQNVVGTVVRVALREGRELYARA